MSIEIFKPDYDGLRGSPRLSGPEAQALRLEKPALVRRLHDAVLTLQLQKGGAPAAVGSGSPAHIVEFSDRVGEEMPPPPRATFQPTAAQVSDMPVALALLNGLRRPFYRVVYLRALDEFARENGERSDWTWAKIGAACGFSDRWAESAYQAAIVQAARASGLLPAVTADYAVVIAGVYQRGVWLTNIGTAADPRQAVYNLRSKSPVRLDDACAVWVAGSPVAKRIVDELKPEMRSLLDHGAWYKTNPDVMIERVAAKAREINAGWHIEDIKIGAVLAA